MIYKTKGIVLNQIKYGETSLIVQVYTEKFGRQSYMVKGGRSKKSSMKSNLFRPFFLLENICGIGESNRTFCQT